MAEIVSFGKYENKTNIFKMVWMEIAELSLFAKLTILITIIIPLIVLLSSEEVLQKNNYASEPIQDVSSALPSNCHLAVDFTQCPKNSTCQPKPKVICDIQNK